MREACLHCDQQEAMCFCHWRYSNRDEAPWSNEGVRRRTLMAECSALAISLSSSSRGLLPKISGSQNCPTAPFIWVILPCVGGGALTHWDGSLPTPHTM